MKKLFSFAGVAIACALFVCSATTSNLIAGGQSVKTITITNSTTFDVHEIYLSPVDETEWGDDILNSDEVLAPGESIDVEITCGMWDAQLVAGDGSTCQVDDVDICSVDIWNIVADC